MRSRLSINSRDFAPMHSKQAIWILHFTVDLIHLADANQRFHANPSTLEEWADVRANLGQCKEPIMHFGSNFVHQDGELLEHRELMWAVDAVITELKLRNLGAEQRDIDLDEVHHIRGLVSQLDQCRKRVVFY